jgi:hypothetical protein
MSGFGTKILSLNETKNNSVEAATITNKKKRFIRLMSQAASSTSKTTNTKQTIMPMPNKAIVVMSPAIALSMISVTAGTTVS